MSRVIDIEELFELMLEGKTYRYLSEHFNIPLSSLFKLIHSEEHSARAKYVLSTSSDMFADKAEEVLKECEGTKEEIMRARELAQHYRWKASKRNPKKYGDKIDITSDNEKLNQPTLHIQLDNKDIDLS